MQRDIGIVIDRHAALNIIMLFVVTMVTSASRNNRTIAEVIFEFCLNAFTVINLILALREY